ncbi:uncharacterized protein PHACADRAFT_24941 [Phanerochaete carnosa HHB-10118-sp]|uniref:Uncharacterized protein n=1 Tax=Phanerochaete carnosa (strain HHB-10118-sp) TaxID=650164 RepID=K5VFM9_PHACS|nr:uncharacterized protein PHACADRAFT_24941 [Phanerochaete carnosa HHB-10118-sp]EKM61801.1 hypothetical protein PHACADRAFT_24941 [Phanerochaete carnosa HHB-10118-sp]
MPLAYIRRWLRFRRVRSPSLLKHNELRVDDEEDAAADETRDVDILISLDETLQDDHLVVSMLDSLKQLSDPLRSLVKFMKHVLARRLHQDGERLVVPFSASLFRLSGQQWSLMVSGLADGLTQQPLIPGTRAMTRPEVDALLMILSPSKYSYPPHIEHMVTHWITDPSVCASMCHSLSYGEPIPRSNMESLIATVRTLADRQVLDGAETVIALDHVALWCIWRHAGPEPPQFPAGHFTIVGSTALLRTHITTLGCRTISQTLVSALLQQNSSRLPYAEDAEIPMWVGRALSTWFTVVDVLSIQGGSWLHDLNVDFKCVFSRLLAAPSSTRTLLQCLVDADWELTPGSEVESGLHNGFTRVIKESSMTGMSAPVLPHVQKPDPYLDQTGLAGSLLEIFKERTQLLMGAPNYPLAALERLCYIAVHLLDPDALKDEAPREAWRTFFSCIALTFKSICGVEPTSETKHLAERCLRRMHVLDTTSKWGLITTDDEKPSYGTYYKFWLRSPKRTDSIFEDDLIYALTGINPDAALSVE